MKFYPYEKGGGHIEGGDLYSLKGGARKVLHCL